MSELTPQIIADIRKNIEQESLFSNKKHLDFLHLPSKIIGRQSEAKQLLKYLCNFNDGFSVPLISVYGRSGIGKSSVVRFVSENISDVACTGFVNFRRQKTIFGCANMMLEELGVASLKSSQGLNKVIDIMEKRIIEILDLEKKNLLVFVLDEFDVIFYDSHGDASDFIYKLLVLEENLREKGLYVCFVTVSNGSIFDHTLDDRVRSRIGESEIYFPPYSKDDLLEILYDRINHTNLKINNDVVEKCAEICSQEHGDCRRALQLLCEADSLASDTVTTNDLDSAIKKLEIDKTEISIKQATAHQKLVLLALAEITLYEKAPTTNTIYNTYCSLNTDVKKLSYRRIYDILVELERLRIISKKTKSKGRYGYAAEFTLLVDAGIIGWLVDFDWWAQTQDDKARTDKFIEENKRKFRKSSQ